MATGRGRLRPAAGAVATAAAIFLVGSGIAWAVASYDDEQRRKGEEASAASSLAVLERRTTVISLVAAGPADGLAVLRRNEVPAVIRVAGRTNGPAGLISGGLPAGVVLDRLVAESRTAMEDARDTGQPQAGPPQSQLVPIITAEYRPGPAPDTVGQRRNSVVAWRLVVLSPVGILEGLPVSRPKPAALLVDGTPVTVAPPGETAGTVLVAGQPWTLVMGTSSSPLSRGAVGVFALAVLAALAGLIADARTQRVLHRVRAASAALERETRTVAELGPLLQSSLDLAEVLPAVSLRLADEFELSSFGVQLLGEQGHLVDVFALGARARSGGDEVLVGPGAADELPAGAVGVLPLLRAGRTIGRLTFTGHRALGQAQLAALSAASDLIAVASYNVELFEREQASVRRLRELDQLKDAFLSTISHELRTPLTAISGFVRLLRDRWGQLREDQRLEFLDRVHGNTLSLGLLVDDLLDFARLERQALNAPATPVDLDQEVAKTLGQLAPVLGQHELISELQPVRAMANAGALERVLANLLTNAGKFSAPDSRIVVSVQHDVADALLVVADHGAGIAAEDRERVFTRFYRGESDAARGTRGAGIGLAVVRELVQQMGGTVKALPNSPRGTRMVVRLPLASNRPAAAPPPNGMSQHAERSTP